MTMREPEGGNGPGGSGPDGKRSDDRTGDSKSGSGPRYVLLPDVDELARAVSDPEVRRLVMEAFEAMERKPPAVGQEKPAKQDDPREEDTRRPELSE